MKAMFSDNDSSLVSLWKWTVNGKGKVNKSLLFDQICSSLVVIGNVAVGRHFANERSLTLSEGFLGQRQSARPMISSKITGSGCARSQRSRDNLFIDMPSELVVFVIDLQGDSVRIEPVE